MTHCSSCGKPIDKMPDWLSDVKVQFVCNNCPNRHTKNIAFMTLEAEVPSVKLDEESDLESEDVADEDIDADA